MRVHCNQCDHIADAPSERCPACGAIASAPNGTRPRFSLLRGPILFGALAAAVEILLLLAWLGFR